MKRNKKWVSIIVVLLILATILFYKFFNNDIKKPIISHTPQFTKQGELSILKSNTQDTIKTIDIELAIDHEQIKKGMMYRTSMEESQGMLFLMPNETIQNFWMKNTQVSLDILYINSAMEIVSIGKYAVPFSEQQISSIFPAKFVLETVAGFADKYGIKEGDLIVFKRM